MKNEKNLALSMAAGMMGRARRRIARREMNATEKTQGPLTDDTLLKIQQELAMSVLPEETWEWVAKYGQTLIQELKRLCARPMQAREKILRDALDRAKAGNIRVREFLREPRKDNLIAFLLDEYEAILWSIKQADEINGIE